MFTKQHYEALAKFISYLPMETSKAHIIKALADMLEKDNPKFDRDKFTIESFGKETKNGI